MQELKQLFIECLDKYNKCETCDSNSCKQGFYCLANNCAKGKCDRCLNHIQWNPSPYFHYPCTKITYHYVLRFFNRFASEIAYATYSFKDDYLKDKQYLNVVSLGCGPGSEVFGFIWTLRKKAPNIVLNYQGFDLNDIWNNVQRINQGVFANTPHKIDFYGLNMFGAYKGFSNGHCEVLVLNYLLSDAQKYCTDESKIKFINDIARFVLEKNVKSILFNDNSYYGTGGLDTGVGMMFRLIKELKKQDMQITTQLRCFPSDSYTPGKWISYKKETLLFPSIPGNIFDANINCCNSKQILVVIN